MCQQLGSLTGLCLEIISSCCETRLIQKSGEAQFNAIHVFSSTLPLSIYCDSRDIKHTFISFIQSFRPSFTLCSSTVRHFGALVSWLTRTQSTLKYYNVRIIRLIIVVRICIKDTQINILPIRNQQECASLLRVCCCLLL